ELPAARLDAAADALVALATSTTPVPELMAVDGPTRELRGGAFSLPVRRLPLRGCARNPNPYRPHRSTAL
ncbi:hypothetical protein, partial [Streptomyces sp. NPDC002346]